MAMMLAQSASLAARPVVTAKATRVQAIVAAPRMAKASAGLSSKAALGATKALRMQKAEISESGRATSLRVRAGLLDSLKPNKGNVTNVLITGTSSGLGLYSADAVVKAGNTHLICAVRDVQKMQSYADEFGWAKGSYTILPLDLASFDDTKAFVKRFRKTGKRLDVLCCNAAVYLPNQQEPTFTEDGMEMSAQVNHLSHFLLVQLMLPDLRKGKNPRCMIVGSITGNTNTVGGGAVAPFADLGDMKGLADFTNVKTGMMDGKAFNGAKAYKDSKLANMMTVLQLHERLHEETGIVFTSMYPGCIAETNLFRQKRGWFRYIFPIFMKYVTGGYVGQEEAGERLAQTLLAPECDKSGVYWSWNGGARTVGRKDLKTGTVVGAGGAGGEIFENRPSFAVKDKKKGQMLWDYSMKAVGLEESKKAFSKA